MVYGKVKELLCSQLGLDESGVTPESDIMEDLGADSLDLAELISTLEDELNVMITDERVRGLRTVGEVVEFIENLL
ncbi:MAG: acyl carrier protein [Oscillospiraceae bacterium]|nr:acyl carrier protein [Oscillospiraceae bacterium]